MVAVKDVKVEIDVAVLQEQVSSIKNDVSAIKENHLPHIYDMLKRIDVRLAYWAGAVAAATAIIQVVIQIAIKTIG